MYTDHKIESNGKATFSICELSQLEIALLHEALLSFDKSAELVVSEEAEAFTAMRDKVSQELKYFMHERSRL